MQLVGEVMWGTRGDICARQKDMEKILSWVNAKKKVPIDVTELANRLMMTEVGLNCMISM